MRLATAAAGAFGVAPRDLDRRTRGSAEMALARQTAIYLARVVFGMTLHDAGGLFGRDRTTAAHACRIVEDLRDDARFDARLSEMEEAVARPMAEADESECRA